MPLIHPQVQRPPSRADDFRAGDAGGVLNCRPYILTEEETRPIDASIPRLASDSERTSNNTLQTHSLNEPSLRSRDGQQQLYLVPPSYQSTR